MFVKLDIQGELLDKLKEESENQFRSCTQQVMYILSKYYKEKENNNKHIQFTETENTNIEYKVNDNGIYNNQKTIEMNYVEPLNINKSDTLTVNNHDSQEDIPMESINF